MISGDYWVKIKQIAELNRWVDQAQAKFDIFDKLFHTLDGSIETILLPKFNPVVLLLEKHYKCYVVEDQSTKYTWQSNSEFIDKISDVPHKVDAVLAIDEYFTYANSEIEQRNLVSEIQAVTNGYLITTLQDYKNSAPHKRSQVDAFANEDSIILEQHAVDKINRQNWKTHIYFIENNKDLTVLGPADRRTMYFKQLAKYTSDLNATEYSVQKNMLYRGFFKKNYEHIITIKF